MRAQKFILKIYLFLSYKTLILLDVKMKCDMGFWCISGYRPKIAA